MTRKFGLLIALVVLATPVGAETSCTEQMRDVVAQWSATFGDELPSRVDPLSSPAHPHTPGEVTYIREQLRQASLACQAGKEHDAMLRLDVVRAWLKLPEIRHPSSHPPPPTDRNE